jgi:hypothetical protein
LPAKNWKLQEITEIDGDRWLGITVRSGSPVLALCRKLVEAGRDPAAPLDESVE